MAYIGAEPLPGQNREVDDISSSFNGSTTAFTLQVSSVNVSPESANNILVSLGGVIQNPGTDYTIAASTLTFTTAPASGLDFFGLILGAGINTATVADQTIGTSKILDNAVTADKLASGLALTGDVSIEDKIVHTGDTNTAIRFPAADTFTAETGGSERLRIDSSGNIGIGTSSPSSILHVNAGTGNLCGLFESTDAEAQIRLKDSGSSIGIIAATDGAFAFENTTTGNLVNIKNDGKVGIGTTAPEVMLDIRANDPGVQLVDTSGTNAYGNISFVGDTLILLSRAGTSSDGLIDFRRYDGTTIDTSMRITAAGNVLIGTTSNLNSGRQIVDFTGGGRGVGIKAPSDAAGSQVLHFYAGTSQVGNVSVTTSATSYATSSDYRLKENVVAISDGITRLKTLKPYRFNFKVDASTTVDGFFAHEVTAVPEAITGTKDEVDSDNKPVYQGIDQSKLVPLLTAALQESVKKIETLETKVAALEAA